jgi:hypothetical protein
LGHLLALEVGEELMRPVAALQLTRISPGK